ncbi:MAG: CPBP family intramembrane metalloprotease [Streptococcaceae bacterium]|nr:CPBP family intramembrane metalloprotease [Streptococcaceae bacterium]
MEKIKRLKLFERILLFIGLMFYYVVSRPVLLATDNQFVANHQIFFGALSIILIILFLFYLLKVFQINLLTNPFTVKKILLFVVGYIAFQYSFRYLPFLLHAGISVNQSGIDTLAFSFPLADFIAGSIGAPLIEETLYRGVFFQLFFQKKARFRPMLLILTSGLAFGMMHMLAGFDWGNLIVYSAGGWILGAVRYYSADLKPSMLIHFLWNTFGFILH